MPRFVAIDRRFLVSRRTFSSYHPEPARLAGYGATRVNVRRENLSGLVKNRYFLSDDELVLLLLVLLASELLLVLSEVLLSEPLSDPLEPSDFASEEESDLESDPFLLAPPPLARA
jgi:hypothetical protein